MPELSPADEIYLAQAYGAALERPPGDPAVLITAAARLFAEVVLRHGSPSRERTKALTQIEIANKLALSSLEREGRP